MRIGKIKARRGCTATSNAPPEVRFLGPARPDSRWYSLPYAPPGPVRDGGRDRGHSDLSLLGPDNHFFNGERHQRQIHCADRK